MKTLPAAGPRPHPHSGRGTDDYVRSIRDEPRPASAGPHRLPRCRSISHCGMPGTTKSLDAALRTLFEAMPNNTDVGEVAVKLAALNGLYATSIFAVVQVATHIVQLGIDARLAEATMPTSSRRSQLLR